MLQAIDISSQLLTSAEPYRGVPAVDRPDFQCPGVTTSGARCLGPAWPCYTSHSSYFSARDKAGCSKKSPETERREGAERSDEIREVTAHGGQSQLVLHLFRDTDPRTSTTDDGAPAPRTMASRTTARSDQRARADRINLRALLELIVTDKATDDTEVRIVGESAVTRIGTIVWDPRRLNEAVPSWPLLLKVTVESVVPGNFYTFVNARESRVSIRIPNSQRQLTADILGCPLERLNGKIVLAYGTVATTASMQFDVIDCNIACYP